MTDWDGQNVQTITAELDFMMIEIQQLKNGMTVWHNAKVTGWPDAELKQSEDL